MDEILVDQYYLKVLEDYFSHVHEVLEDVLLIEQLAQKVEGNVVKRIGLVWRYLL